MGKQTRRAALPSLLVLLLAVACRDSTSPAHRAPSAAPTQQLASPASSGGPWTTKAPMPTRRWGLASGVVNGVLYALGGGGSETGIVATVEAYDPASDTWTTKASIPTARARVAVGVVDGVLYAIGGYADPQGYLATVEAYDPATDT